MFRRAVAGSLVAACFVLQAAAGPLSRAAAPCSVPSRSGDEIQVPLAGIWRCHCWSSPRGMWRGLCVALLRPCLVAGMVDPSPWADLPSLGPPVKCLSSVQFLGGFVVFFFFF